MRILIAPDKFKGSLTAAEAARAIDAGIRAAASESNITIEIDECPVADGGEGTLDAVYRAVGGRILDSREIGPLFPNLVITHRFTWGEEDARKYLLVESAGVLGLSHVPSSDRNPEVLTSFGLGALLDGVVRASYEHVYVGLGGVATVDGGLGLAQALGFWFDADPPVERRDSAIMFDPNTTVEVANALMHHGQPLTAAHLHNIRGFINRPRRLGPQWGPRPAVIALCDVTNPLLGPGGAARVFGPQKGATPEQVERLEAGLENLVRVCREAGLPCDPDAPGAGAAGGLGFGLATFLGAELRPGAPFILNLLKFKERAARADLVITGEGRMDAQTAGGKAAAAVAVAAGELGKPVIAIVGSADHAPDELVHFLNDHDVPIEEIHPLVALGDDPAPAIRDAANRLEQAARFAVSSWLARPHSPSG